MKVLITDDSKMIQFIEKKLLNELGYLEVLAASDVEEAKHILSGGGIGLILSDWHMPGETGLDFLRFVRGHPKFSSIPFIIITTEHEKKCVVEAVKAKVDAYLFKPVQKNVLLEKIKKIAETYPEVTPSCLTVQSSGGSAGFVDFTKHASMYDFGCELFIEHDHREYPLFIGNEMSSALIVQLREMFGEKKQYLMIHGNSGANERTVSIIEKIKESGIGACALASIENKLESVKMIHEKLGKESGSPILLAYGESEVLELGILAAATWDGGIPLVLLPASLSAILTHGITGFSSLPLPELNITISHYPSMIWFDVNNCCTSNLTINEFDYAELVRTAFFCGESTFSFLTTNNGITKTNDILILIEAFGRCLLNCTKIWDLKASRSYRTDLLNFGYQVTEWLYNKSPVSISLLSGTLAFLVELGAIGSSVNNKQKQLFTSFLQQLGKPEYPRAFPDPSSFPGIKSDEVFLPCTPGTVSPIKGISAAMLKEAYEKVFTGKAVA